MPGRDEFIWHALKPSLPWFGARASAICLDRTRPSHPSHDLHWLGTNASDFNNDLQQLPRPLGGLTAFQCLSSRRSTDPSEPRGGGGVRTGASPQEHRTLPGQVRPQGQLVDEWRMRRAPYSSADATAAVPSLPPAIRTSPFSSRVSVCRQRGIVIDPVDEKVRVFGS